MEESARMRKILVIGSLNSVFVYEYILEILLKEGEYQISVLSEVPSNTLACERADCLKKAGCTIRYYYSEQLRNRNGFFARAQRGISRNLSLRYAKEFDIVHIISISIFSPRVSKCIRSNARLIVSFVGSDLLKSSKFDRMLMVPMLNRADVITMETEHEQKVFSELFHGANLEKVILSVYGTNIGRPLKAFAAEHTHEECKEYLHFPPEKICMFVGTNGVRSQRHIDILRSIEKLPRPVSSRLLLVFHCAYALEDEYRTELMEAIRESPVECRMMTEFLTGDRLYALRMSMDVLINIQLTDAFSGTMMECMETDTVIVKGEWLHYPDVERHGAYMVDVSSLEDLTQRIADIAENFETYREKAHGNRGLSRLKSWDYSRTNWMKALGLDAEDFMQ